ncbi:MAG: YcjX family protein [Acetobacteraceae bacterium]
MGLWQELKDQVAATWNTGSATIAIAGLSKSGKTAFITSLIANLEAASRNRAARAWLGGLDVLESGRLCSAERPATFRPRHGRVFPFGDMLARLTADAPHWPVRTADVYEVALDLHFWPKRQPIGGNVPAARLRLILVDYPGEWLADTPMLRQTYGEWSRVVFQRLSAAPWSEVSAGFRRLVAETAWDGADDNETARKAALAWQETLVAARALGLKWLQPAQVIRKRGQSDDVVRPPLDEPALWFCPLPEAAIAGAGRGSLARAMADRYAAYQKDVAAFFGQTLKEASRHLLLVDVLESLAEGQHAFLETAEVLGEVYRLLADSHPGLFARLFRRAGFDKVLLLATKADAIPPSQRAALATLLRDMCVGRVAGNARIVPPQVDFVAAVRATEDVERPGEDGTPARVVEGKCADTGRRRRVNWFDVPDVMPDAAAFLSRAGVRPPRFVPPQIEAGGRLGVPNLRMGRALDDLLGDLLQ